MDSDSDSLPESDIVSDIDSDEEFDYQAGAVIQGQDDQLGDVLYHTYQLCREMNLFSYINTADKRTMDILAMLKVLKRLADLYRNWTKSPTIDRILTRTKRLHDRRPQTDYRQHFFNVTRDTLPPEILHVFDILHHSNQSATGL